MTSGTVELAARGESDPDSGISLIWIVSVLLKYRYLIVASALMGAVLAAVVVLVRDYRYTSSAAFTPVSGSGQANQLASIASRFGLPFSVGSTDAGHSPDFYEDLLTSRSILEDLARDSITGVRDRGPSSILDALRVEGESEQLRVSRGVRRLRQMIRTSVDPATGVVRFSVTTTNPTLSAEVVERLLDRVNQFNLNTRQNQAATEREFIEERLREAQEDLHSAEDSLQEFLEQNRSFEGSPELRFLHDRLQRTVLMRQEVYTALTQHYEEARIREVRNTPLITVVERPRKAVIHDPRRLTSKTLLSFLFGGLLGLTLAIGREHILWQRRQEPAAFDAASTYWHDALSDFRRVGHSALRRRSLDEHE